MRNLWLGTLVASLAGLWLGDAVAAPASAGAVSAEAQLKTCMRQCAKTYKASDDIATCNLECRYQFEDQPAPSASTTPRPATSTVAAPQPAPQPAPRPATSTTWSAADQARCENLCNNEPVVTDRTTCKLNCRAKADNTRTAPASPTPGGPSKYVAPSSATTYTPSGRLSANGPMVYSPNQPGSAPAPANNAALQAQVAQCKNECNRASYRTATDRATCKLTCDNLLDTLPQGTVYHNNTGASGADARRAVIESSMGNAGSPGAQPSSQAQWYRPAPQQPGATGTTPPAPAPKGPTSVSAARAPSVAPATCQAVTACNQGCSYTQTTCAQECDEASRRATDRATCKLTCTSNYEVCSEDCAGKASLCRDKTAKK
jgi:hypothetical protein